MNDVSVTEGDSGIKPLTFIITRSGATSGTASVQWATADGTAVAGSDYVGVPATTVSFAADETTKSVTVTVNGDAEVEANETFSVMLSAPVGATILDGSGTGTIINDDADDRGRAPRGW